MTVRIHMSEGLISGCAQAACTACTVGSLMGAAFLVSVIVVLVTSLR
jgi:hypothetical protein